MLYISFVLVMSLALLEILSRRCIGKGRKYRLFNPSAKFLLGFFRKGFLFDRFRAEIRCSETMSEKQVEEEAEKLFTDTVAKGLRGLLLLDIVVMLLAFMPATGEDSNILKRPGVGEEAVKVNIKLSKGGSEKTYGLELSPREYSKEEFREISDNACKYLDEIISGDNPDLNNVMYDLELPETDETGTLRIEWYSDDTELIGIDGRVNSHDIVGTGIVKLSAVLSDGIHDREYNRTVRVIPYEESGWAEKAENALKVIEEGSREAEKVVLPDMVEGAAVKAESDDEMSAAGKILIFGVILIVCYMILQFNKVRKKAMARQDELLGRYSFFVSSIVLKVGSGLSIREAMISLHAELKKRNKKDSLFDEMNFVVNGLKAGRDEKEVYAEMGRASGVEEYNRLMSMITRNLERGNSNLLELLHKEEAEAFNERKLRARRKGEEAAEKLLIPMFILLITVIGIVMFPALQNF